MDINRANLESLFRTYLTAWQQGLSWVPPTDLSFLFREFPSVTASNFYAWLERIPGFREWVGDRVFNNVRSNRFEVPNRDWEDSVTMPNKDINDDQFGVYTPTVQMMGEGWKELLAEIVLQVLTLNKTAFTGKAFFATDHKYGDNTIANKVTGALTSSTFETAFVTAAGWKFANGKPCRTNFTHLVHGPKLRSTAFAITDAAFVVSGSSQVNNPNYNRVKRVEVADLAGDYDDYWFLLDCSRPVKPIALQIRKVPTPRMDTDPAIVEKSGKVDFFADGRAAAAPTFPHLAYGGIL